MPTMTASARPTVPTSPRPQDRERVVEWLADHDESCPVCAYSLRGLETDQCPECAAPIRLTVYSPRVNPGPWALGLISCALGAGFDAVVTVLFVGSMIVAPPGPKVPTLFYMMPVIFGVAALVSLAGLAWVYLSRPRWPRRPLTRQWIHAWMIFLAVGGSHTVLGLCIYALWA